MSSTTPSLSVQEVNTICGFCGTGCGLTVQVEEGRISKVRGRKRIPLAMGQPVLKGSYGLGGMCIATLRSTEPLVRKDGKLIPTSWDEALDIIANQFGSIKETHGPDAFGCLVQHDPPMS